MHLPTEIVNPATGEQIVFDEAASNEERLVWTESRPANIDPPPTHYHPNSAERFEVIDGTLVLESNGEVYRIQAGEEILIPPGIPHVSYTEAESARFRREVTPPGRWREALTARFATVHAVGERSGITELLQMVLLIRAFPDVIVPQQPPRAVQRVLFPVLAAVARIVGLEAHHEYPRNHTDPSEERAAEPTP